MLAKTPIDQMFYQWVCSKAPNAKYDYASCIDCACGQFAQEVLGLQPATRKFEHAWDKHFWKRRDEGEDEIPSLNHIARGDMRGGCLKSSEWTYGKLRERLERLLPECVGG